MLETRIQNLVTSMMKPLTDMVQQDRNDYSILNNHIEYLSNVSNLDFSNSNI